MTDHTNWTRPDLTAPPDDLSHERGGYDLAKLAQRKAVPADLLRKLPLLIMKLKLIAEDDPHTVVTMSKQYVDVIVEMLEASRDALSVAPSQDREDALPAAIAHERSENATLAGLLRDCDAVMATIQADDSDEAEKIGDLRLAITYALDPYKREGTLL